MIVFVVFGVCTSRNFNQSGLNKIISGNFDEKGLTLKYVAKILARKIVKKSQQKFLSLKIKSKLLLLTTFTIFFGKIDKT